MMTTLSKPLAVAVLACGAVLGTVESAEAQFSFKPSQGYKYRKAVDVDWMGQSNAAQQISGDRKTITFQLAPGVPSINAVRARAEIQWASGNAKWPNTAHFSAAPQSQAGNMTCTATGTSYGLGQIQCTPNATWVRNLTSETRVNVEVGGAAFGKTKKMMTIVYKPFEGGPFVESLSAPRSPQKGDLVSLRIRLTQDAPSGGKRIYYRMVPSDCFSRAPGGVRYRESGLNSVNIRQGDRWIDFTLASDKGCSSATASFQTWAHEDHTNTTSTPWYKAKSFRWYVPRRR
ncbi:MAG: hypothetical protein AAFR11_02650 [Pseudomonadota bacterium]